MHTPGETTSDALRIAAASSQADLLAFRFLNEEWISHFFTLEETDRQQLGDPARHILSGGGQIYLAHLNGQAVGCVALRPSQPQEFELSKMAVSPLCRGQGIGRRLLSYTIEQARNLGARRLVLGSSTKLSSAVHLYEQLGFQHLPPERRPSLPYTRADVFMELSLEGDKAAERSR